MSIKSKIQKILDSMFGSMDFYKNFFVKKQIREEAAAATAYFSKVSERIRNNIELLADEKSKKVYKGMIDFRSKRDWSLFPETDDEQYFPHDIVKKLGGTFVDCGGFDGDTSLDFVARSNSVYDSIVIFEPDTGLQERLNKNLEGKKNIHLIKKGVWNKSTRLAFKTLSNGSSTVEEIAGSDVKLDTIEVTCIDDAVECRAATFIKMDIEGSEWNALHGAEKTIRKNHPVLAICIYHSDLDMVRLIPYIHELNPMYKLYVRHHSSTSMSETVLYAIPE